MGIIKWLFSTETKPQIKRNKMPDEPLKKIGSKYAFCAAFGLPCGKCDAKKYGGCVNKIKQFLPEAEIEIKKNGSLVPHEFQEF